MRPKHPKTPKKGVFVRRTMFMEKSTSERACRVAGAGPSVTGCRRRNVSASLARVCGPASLLFCLSSSAPFITATVLETLSSCRETVHTGALIALMASSQAAAACTPASLQCAKAIQKRSEGVAGGPGIDRIGPGRSGGRQVGALLACWLAGSLRGHAITCSPRQCPCAACRRSCACLPAACLPAAAAALVHLVQQNLQQRHWQQQHGH